MLATSSPSSSCTYAEFGTVVFANAPVPAATAGWAAVDEALATPYQPRGVELGGAAGLVIAVAG